MPPSRKQALQELTLRLRQAGLDSPALDARLLLMAAAGIDAAALYAWPDLPLSEKEHGRLEEMARRRLAREPVAHILGEWEFWGLPFALSCATLVPRPETELLMEAALARHTRFAAGFTFLDLGTGSGCIAVALAHEWPQARGVAVDRSVEALSMARRNAVRNGVEQRLSFVAGSWGDALRGPFDLIVSNPPYIESAAIAGLDMEVRAFDPILALDGGSDGLAPYRAIFSDAGRLLRPGGAVIVEFGQGQAPAVARIAEAGGLQAQAPLRDLAGIERVIVATMM